MLKKRFMCLIMILLFIAAFLIVFFLLPEFDTYNSSSGKLIISEVMPKNSYSIQDDEGRYSDWIEIYNGYDYDVNLEGYILSDKNLSSNGWVFPNIIIKKGEYLIVFASGDDKCDLDTRICHTNFKLSSQGETVMLMDNDTNVISKLTFKKMVNDISYGVKDNKYVYFYTPTAYKQNDGKTSNNPIEREDSNITLYINEYMTNNERYVYTEDGDYVSWIEIYNYGDHDVNLEGMFLSDDSNDISKYIFPKITLKAKNYIVVYCSGIEKEYIDGKELHAPFKLSDNDNKIVLSDNSGNKIDEIRVVSLSDNISYGRKEDGWYYFASPTIGRQNNTQSFEMIEGILKKKVIINEVNSVGNEWVEIKNTTNDTINLKGYTFFDKKKDTVFTFPSINIKPNSYLVIYCGNDSNSYKNGKLYSNINIDNDGETLYLANSEGGIIDSFETGRMISGVSVGLDLASTKVYYKNSTPGTDNSLIKFSGYSSIPVFSIDGGYVKEGTTIYLSSSNNSTIYYTLDGSFPTNKSNLYNQKGIKIDKTTVVKAISYTDNKIESEVVSRTFLVGRQHDMAVVSISTDYDSLFSSSRGIYHNNNFRKDWESKISFEFYESNGAYGTSFNGGTKLVGQDSRVFPQKSFAIFLRKDYGLKEVTYPFFLDHDVQTFSSFILRNSGEDVNYLKFKDAFLIEIIKGQMDLDFQYYRPVVLYVNGQYWGIYNIREKINESYLANNHGVDEDNLTLIKGNRDVKAGNMDDYNDLIKYVTTHNMSKKSNYDYIKTKIDIQELINFWICQTYYYNTDSGNIRFWKENTEDGKWRWVLFDLDWSMYPSTYMGMALMRPFEPYGHGAGRGFSTALTYNLWKNEEFRDQYLKSFSYHLQTTFKPERVIKILEDVSSLYRNEMPYQIERWKDEFISQGHTTISSMEQWEYRVNLMKTMVTNRYNWVVNALKSQFGLSNKEYEYYFGEL